MQRAALFLLLVVVVPTGVYWAGNGGSLAGLPGELRELKGASAEPPRRTGITPEPKPVPTQPGEPEPPPPTPPSPAEGAREKAERLFREGRFADAAEAFRGVDDQRRSLALLGDAFVHAFPPALPTGTYVVVRARTGESYEGFGETTGGLLRIVDAAGKSFSLPESAISERRELSREEARERIARQALDSTDIAGPRIFALIQAACAAGRPDAAAVLLEPALRAEEKEPYFLSAVRSRVPAERQKDMYVAFATAQTPAVMAPEPDPVVRVPSRLGGRKEGTPAQPPAVKNPEVRAFMEQAAPYRKRGEELYKEIVLKGADASMLDQLNEAIAAFDKALALYEKAMLVEESNLLSALASRVSRLNFNLRFWREQLQGR